MRGLHHFLPSVFTHLEDGDWFQVFGICSLLLLAGPSSAHGQPELTPPRLLRAPVVSIPDGPDGATAITVELLLEIDTEGRVRDAHVVSPHSETVDAMVLAATERMRFEPARAGSEVIGARIRFAYRVEFVRPQTAEAVLPPPPPQTPPGESETPDPDEGEDEEEGEASPIGVTAVVGREEEGAADRFTLRGPELTTVPGTFGEPLRAVASMPSVARSPFNLGFFLVRGSDFQNTGFMVDGFPVPLLYHVGAGPAIIPSRFVDEMHFYAGNYPARYGRFSGGLVNLETNIPRVSGPTGELSVDAARASILTIVPFEEGRGAVAAGFRRSYFELILPLIVDGIDLSYTDYQLLGRYQVDDHMRLSFFFFGADDRLDQNGQLGDGLLSAGSRSSASFDLQRLIASLTVDLDGGHRFRFSTMLGRDGTAFDTAQPGFGLLHFELEAFFAGWRMDLELHQDEHLRGRIGFDINTLSARVIGTAPVPPGLGEFARPLPTLPTSDENLVVTEAFAAAYYEQVVDLAPVELSAALRVDVMRYGDRVELIPDPRAVARLRVHPMVTLKAASGLFVQQPSPFTIFRVGGNPDIAPERAWQSSAGVELNFPMGVEGRLSGFYNRMWQIARGVDEIVPTDDGLRRVFFVDDGEGQAYGLEALLRMRHEGFYGWISYTLSRSERFHDGGQATLFAFDQTHVLNLVMSYGFDGWRFGGRFQLATGRPIGTVREARFDADTGGFSRIPNGEIERLPYAHQLDLRIDRDFEVGPVRGSVFIDVANVYFSENPEGRIYQYDFARSAFLRGLPIIPTIGIRGTLG